MWGGGRDFNVQIELEGLAPHMCTARTVTVHHAFMCVMYLNEQIGADWCFGFNCPVLFTVQ